METGKYDLSTAGSMVSVGDADGNTNIITVAWTGTICTNPAMAYISVRPERYSYE